VVACQPVLLPSLATPSPPLHTHALCCAHDIGSIYSGYLAYEDVVRQLLDADYFAMFNSSNVDHTQALADATATSALVAALRTRINAGSVDEMRHVFAAFDTSGSGLVPGRAFQAACAALGVVLSQKEATWVASIAGTPDGAVHWGTFCDALDN
jgi:hypothetical protein